VLVYLCQVDIRCFQREENSMDLKAELLALTRTLNEASIPYALCGGMAVTLHGFPRLTRDVDLLIQETDLERVRETLAIVGFSIPGGTIPFDVGKPFERRVFRVSKRVDADLLTVDLLLLPALLEDVWNEREVYDVDGVPVAVVSRPGLLKMKRIAGRPQDLLDIETLEGEDDAT